MIRNTVKNFLAAPHYFIKLFHLQQSQGILDSPYNSNRSKPELG